MNFLVNLFVMQILNEWITIDDIPSIFREETQRLVDESLKGLK